MQPVHALAYSCPGQLRAHNGEPGMAGRMVHAALNTCFMHTAFAQVCNRSSFRLELIYTGSAGGFLHCEYAAGVELAMLMVRTP